VCRFSFFFSPSFNIVGAFAPLAHAALSFFGFKPFQLQAFSAARQLQAFSASSLFSFKPFRQRDSFKLFRQRDSFKLFRQRDSFKLQAV